MKWKDEEERTKRGKRSQKKREKGKAKSSGRV